jgi:hypothetical protein
MKKPDIETITAFVGVDENGEESLLMMRDKDGEVYPMITSNDVNIEHMISGSQQLVDDQGMEIRIIRFSNRELVETLTKNKTV